MRARHIDTNSHCNTLHVLILDCHFRYITKNVHGILCPIQTIRILPEKRFSVVLIYYSKINRKFFLISSRWIGKNAVVLMFQRYIPPRST